MNVDTRIWLLTDFKLLWKVTLLILPQDLIKPATSQTSVNTLFFVDDNVHKTQCFNLMINMALFLVIQIPSFIFLQSTTFLWQMRDKKILGFYHPKGPTLAGVRNLASLQIDEICSFSVQKKKEIEAQSTEPASLTFHFVLRKLYTVPSIGAFYQISVHLPKRLQRRRFF